MDDGSDWCEPRDFGVDGKLCDVRKGGVVTRQVGEAGGVGGEGSGPGLTGDGVDGIFMKSNSKLLESLTGVRLFFFLEEDLDTGELGTGDRLLGVCGDENLSGRTGDLVRVRPFFFGSDGCGTEEGVDG